VSLNSTLSVHSCPFTDPLHHLPALIYCTPSNHPPCPHLLYSFKPPSLPSFTPSNHPPCPHLLLHTTLPALIYSFVLPSPQICSFKHPPCPHLLLHTTLSALIYFFILLCLLSFTPSYYFLWLHLLLHTTLTALIYCTPSYTRSLHAFLHYSRSLFAFVQYSVLISTPFCTLKGPSHLIISAW
jgi:hypothetical protein